jgi:transposase-like protein
VQFSPNRAGANWGAPSLTDRDASAVARRLVVVAVPAAGSRNHKRLRHSNFIERTFGETRRRVKVIGRLPGERSCLGLVWAVLDRASRGWRGVTMTPATVRQLQELRRQLLHPTATNETVTPAA